MSISLDQFTINGKFLMLALDHRQGIRKIINPAKPNSVRAEEVIKLKREIIEALRDQISGLLIDPEYGLPAIATLRRQQAGLAAYNNRTKPFLLPLEKTGYIGEDGQRITELEYTVQKLKNWGADGAKLLIYFNPNVASAKTQLETARRVITDCKTHNFPLFLEIVTYTPDVQPQFHIGSESGGKGFVFESVKTFVQEGVLPDVFKIEYPGSEEGCRLVSGILGDIPWILLTGGDSFEVFKEHLTVAVKGGARGFLAGRALWQELPSLSGEKRQGFLLKTLPERFKTLVSIVEGHEFRTW